MSATFDEPTAAALLAQFKRELMNEHLELTPPAEAAVAHQLDRMLARSEDAPQLAAQLYQQMPRYVGRLVARALAGRDRFSISHDDATVTVSPEDLSVVFAKCTLCEGLGTPPP